MLLHFASLCTKIWERLYNAEMKCFQVLHRLLLIVVLVVVDVVVDVVVAVVNVVSVVN